MTPRRRARAQVERTPGMRGTRAEVLIIDDPWTPTTPPGAAEEVMAWWRDLRPSDPPAQAGALFRREDIDAAVARGVAMTPAEREALLRADSGTFSNRAPSQPMTVDALRRVGAWLRWDEGADEVALSRKALLAEIVRYGSAGRGDDYTDALALAWAKPYETKRGARARIAREAVERTGRVLVSWLIGRWRR